MISIIKDFLFELLGMFMYALYVAIMSASLLLVAAVCMIVFQLVYIAFEQVLQ